MAHPMTAEAEGVVISGMLDMEAFCNKKTSLRFPVTSV
jgi:hypothetical protein